MLQKVREWLSLKNYQYQVTTGIYMLEPWERTIFSILFYMNYSMSVLFYSFVLDQLCGKALEIAWKY